MEPRHVWNLLTASLAVCDKRRPFAAWAFLVIQGLVRDAPGDRELFADLLREETDRWKGVELPPPGPSLAWRVAQGLSRAGVVLPAASAPDPGGKTAAQRLEAVGPWGGVADAQHLESVRQRFARQ